MGAKAWGLCLNEASEQRSSDVAYLARCVPRATVGREESTGKWPLTSHSLFPTPRNAEPIAQPRARPFRHRSRKRRTSGVHSQMIARITAGSIQCCHFMSFMNTFTPILLVSSLNEHLMLGFMANEEGGEETSFFLTAQSAIHNRQQSAGSKRVRAEGRGKLQISRYSVRGSRIAMMS